jgi:hypothetical protein
LVKRTTINPPLQSLWYCLSAGQKRRDYLG